MLSLHLFWSLSKLHLYTIDDITTHILFIFIVVNAHKLSPHFDSSIGGVFSNRHESGVLHLTRDVEEEEITVPPSTTSSTTVITAVLVVVMELEEELEPEFTEMARLMETKKCN